MTKYFCDKCGKETGPDRVTVNMTIYGAKFQAPGFLEFCNVVCASQLLVSRLRDLMAVSIGAHTGSKG
jgi:hypothetical protein